MDKVRTKTRNTRNYSGRHIGEVCPPDERVRVYRPQEDRHGMSGGRTIQELACYPKADNCYHGFADESTRRVHID